MSELDELQLEKSYGTILLKRFIDDIFPALVSQDMDADKLLEISNGLNDAIKFTIEKPNADNQLPFLDTLVSLDERTSKFSAELYIKPFHSQAIIPWTVTVQILPSEPYWLEKLEERLHVRRMHNRERDHYVKSRQCSNIMVIPKDLFKRLSGGH